MPNTATHARGFRWQLEWRTTLFVLVLVPVFLALGNWQLRRADEKLAILESWELRRQQAATPLLSMPESAEDLAYRRVSLRGEYDWAHSFMLDNRIRQGRYGLEVLTPFRLQDNGLTVLVNRGWIQADPLRQTLPDVTAPAGDLVLEGYIYIPPGEAYTLGDLATAETWPRLVQSVDTGEFASMLDADVYPHVVRIAQYSPGALIAEWPLVNVRPQKHQAYAAQWFAMAFALAVMFVWRCSNLASVVRNWRGNDSTDQ